MLLKLEIRHVHRYRLDNNWIMLNCDGTYKSSTSIVGCDGLFTYSSENLVIDYAQKNGLCDALTIQMFVILHGLQLTWNEIITNQVIEIDSKVLMYMVRYEYNFPTLVWRIRQLIQKGWHIRFRHTCHEDNQCTHQLVNYNLTLKTLISSFFCLSQQITQRTFQLRITLKSHLEIFCWTFFWPLSHLL